MTGAPVSGGSPRSRGSDTGADADAPLAAVLARLERIERVLGRLERFTTIAIDAAPFWLRSKIKGAMSNDEAGNAADTAGDTARLAG